MDHVNGPSQQRSMWTASTVIILSRIFKVEAPLTNMYQLFSSASRPIYAFLHICVGEETSWNVKTIATEDFPGALLSPACNGNTQHRAYLQSDENDRNAQLRVNS